MTTAQNRYRLASPQVGRSILHRLGDRFALQRGTPLWSIRVYLDTFDWRFHEEGAVLMVVSANQRSTLELIHGGGKDSLTCPVAAVPSFAEDLPAGKLRDAVNPMSANRRFLPLVEVMVESEPARILDKRRKTVARIRLEKRVVKSAPEQQRDLPALLCIEPLKGYRREFDEVVAFLESACDLKAEMTGEQVEVLGAVGRTPGDYGSRLHLDLVPEAPAADEVRRILRGLLDTLVANEDGLRKDLDIEFLHDFRVAVRRTRTALSQIRGVFPPPVLDSFKPEFSWLGKLTGPTRDLDVYLLKMSGYRATLPAAVSGDLEPLQRFLESHRVDELRKLLLGLDSPRFFELVRRWRRFLERRPGPDATAPDADLPVHELASREIGRAYRRFLKKGRAIDDSSPAAALHRLRIDGKKLRYLLEFFSSLFNAEEIDDLIAALKRVQDNLGDFNDYGVQQGMLSSFGQQMVDEGFTSPRALMAMGRLIDKLERGEAEERTRFAERFGRFDSRKNWRRYKKLFRP